MAHSPDYDFIGFTFGEHYFRDIHVLHVSDGSRYNDNLAPTMQDKTVQVPGGHGTYYFGSYYTQRTFSVQVAYDSITEQDIRTLRQMTNWGVQKLTFDEQPYKTYMAKLSGTPQLKYICFDDGETDRVYKGEGTLQFTCFEPFAHCVEGQKFKEYWMSMETVTTTIPIPDTDPIQYQTIERRKYPNAEEWLPASKIKPQGSYDAWSSNAIPCYNPGDLEADFYLYINFSNGTISNFTISMNNKQLNIDTITKKDNDALIRINSKNHLIEGGTGTADSFVLSGNIYNEYITSGDFFKIPLGDSTLSAPQSIIKYDYLYL